MCAISSRHGRTGRSVRVARARGFTLPELIAVMMMVGVLAAVALPKLQVGTELRGDTWRDEVVAALRHARHTAVSHRRLVCASIGSTVTLTIAPANPATSCSAALSGPDGGTAYTTAPSGVSATVAPVGLLYFQPDGRITSDGAGSTATDRSVTVSGASLGAITVVGETGHVR